MRMEGSDRHHLFAFASSVNLHAFLLSADLLYFKINSFSNTIAIGVATSLDLTRPTIC